MYVCIHMHAYIHIALTLAKAFGPLSEVPIDTKLNATIHTYIHNTHMHACINTQSTHTSQGLRHAK